jgi:uncharacterized membrane protein
LLDQHALSFVIRFVHVAAMAIVLGGAALIWSWLTVAGRPQSSATPSLLLDLAVSYEWLAWLAIGLLVMTGVGNLGAFGAALPSPQSGWGERLTIKLLLVVLLLVGSLLRTLLVALLAAEERPGRSATDLALLRSAYGATSVLATGVLVSALALAHG